MKLRETLSFVFCFCSLGFLWKTQFVCEKIRLISTIFEIVKILLSSLQSTEKQTKKTFIFCFCPVPFLLLFFFQHFSLFFTFITVVFVHFSLSSKCSSLLDFALLFHLSFLLPSFFLYLSVSLPLFSSISCFHIFFQSPFFCVSSFGLTHFASLFCSWSHSSFLPFFLRFRILSFMSNQIQNFLFFFSIFFLNPPFLCV